MRIEVSTANGEAITQRGAEMQQLYIQFESMRREDKRHSDCIVRDAGYNPDDYSQYNMAKVDGRYYMELIEKPREQASSPVPASVAQLPKTNGDATRATRK